MQNLHTILHAVPIKCCASNPKYESKVGLFSSLCTHVCSFTISLPCATHLQFFVCLSYACACVCYWLPQSDVNCLYLAVHCNDMFIVYVSIKYMVIFCGEEKKCEQKKQSYLWIIMFIFWSRFELRETVGGSNSSRKPNVNHWKQWGSELIETKLMTFQSIFNVLLSLLSIF